MKKKYLKLKNWLIISSMGILGLSACHSNKNIAANNDNGKTSQNDPEEIFIDTDEDDLSNNPVIVKQESPNPREPQVTVYGVPTVNFAVKGKVTDPSGKPIKGLQVLLLNSDIDPSALPEGQYWDSRLARISDTTDATGNYEVRSTDRPWEKQNILVRDIDGKLNGNFENQLIEVEFTEQDEAGKAVSRWNLGEKRAEVNIKMKRKK